MKRFLVTGGAGFIGSHIAETLVKKGHFVRVLDNFCSGKKENIENFISKIELIKGDIRSLNTCIKATKHIDFVLHQAALRSVPKSFEKTQEYHDVNINGTLNMLKGSVENKIKSFVFASSSSVYGDVSKFPEKEDFLPEPISPYALTKLVGEHYCKMFSCHYKLPTISLRYFNVFGPRQSLDDQYAVVIPKFVNCILKNESMPIYGTGKQSRDFTYVDNVVQANILAAGKINSKGQVFNVACGKNYTILALVKLLNKIMQANIKPVFKPIRKGDVMHTLADISKIKKILGFKPTVNFQEGLIETVVFFKNSIK